MVKVLLKMAISPDNYNPAQYFLLVLMVLMVLMLRKSISPDGQGPDQDVFSPDGGGLS